MKTSSSHKLRYLLIVFLAVFGSCQGIKAACTVSYLGATWGPDGESIYFIKQLDDTDRQYWLCKMKWDGTEKTEIAELWRGQNAIVLSTIWMDANGTTSNIAFSVEYGNEAAGGLWVVGMDGKNQRRPFPLAWNTEAKWKPLHPSWSPDGTQLVFEEDDHTARTSSVARLTIYDLGKKVHRRLTEGPRDEHPVWSPHGDLIAYTHYVRYDNRYADRRIWLIHPDGSEQKPMTDEKGKTIFGWWPSWNPEGNRVSIDRGLLVFAGINSNKLERIDPLYILGERSPWLFNGHHWGKHGWTICSGGDIIEIDTNSHKAKIIASHGVTNPKGAVTTNETLRWGMAPEDLEGKK